MEQDWDPQVKKYFLKILKSVSLGLTWAMACAVAGIYFKLGYLSERPVIYTILFYTGMFITLLLLIKYLYNVWKDE